MRGHRIKLRATKYNPQPKTRKHPNIQRTLNAEGKHVYACTQCIRTIAKNARIKIAKTVTIAKPKVTKTVAVAAKPKEPKAAKVVKAKVKKAKA